MQRNGQLVRIVTFLTEALTTLRAGVPPQAVVGILGPDDSLQVNPLFREFLHETIARHAPLEKDMQQTAAAHRDGRLVRQGRIIAGSYLPNPDRRIPAALVYSLFARQSP